MATKSDTLVSRRGRPTKHKWDHLLDGEIWTLKKGEDFTSQARSFVSQARRAAEAKGLELVSRTVESEYLRENPDNPKSPFKRDGEGNKVKDATTLQVVAYDPTTHKIEDGRVVELTEAERAAIEADADDGDDEPTTDED